MTKKIDNSLTKSQALIQAWKKRSDYKGYDKSKGSSYNSWRSIVYTEKGKKIGFPESWAKYSDFFLDVCDGWEHGMILVRIDKEKPYSKSNVFWSKKGTENISKLTLFEYNGINKTLLEWCAELNLNYNGVRQRLHKGKNLTKKEILFGKETKKRNKQEKSDEFKLARKLGAYRLRDKKKGFFNDMTIEVFKELAKKGCFYCNDDKNIGLDRIDNSKGHEVSNVVPCCYDCNSARNSNFSFEEMKIIGNTINKIKANRNEDKQKRTF